MAGRRVLALVALSQMLAAPFAAAQFGPSPPAIRPPGPPPYFDQPQESRGCEPVGAFQPLPDMAPLKQDATARLQIVVLRDGRIAEAHILEGAGSGDAARDAALLARVRKEWRYKPRGEACGRATLRVTVHYPHITCAPQPLLETQTGPELDEYPDRPRSTELKVALLPDGTVASATVTRGSGDAALDRRAAAHVKAAWRWQPFACPDPSAPVTGTATIAFPYAVQGPPPEP